MKEVRNLGRGWAGGSASLSSPARRFVQNNNDRLDKCTLRPHSVRIPPSAISGSLAPCGWSGRPSSSWSPLFGGRQSAALPDWSCCGAQYLGKAATWCLQVVFCPQAQAWTRWQIGGDCNAIEGAQATGAVFRASAHLSQVLVGAGVTPAVHSHAPAPSAPAVTACRCGAHGRVNSDRSGPSMLEADWTLKDRVPARQPGVRVLAGLTPWSAVGVFLPFGQQEVRPVGSGALRIRARITRPGSTSRTRDHASGRPHPVPLASNVDVPLAARFCTVAPFGQWVQTPCPYTFSACMAGP